ncbi:MAG: DNA-protecting protein DprA [Alphaproteobacteria bacterium]|nr:MAG: DNA-protecting protein DprA [Alphaproteobacteria bacterium]
MRKNPSSDRHAVPLAPEERLARLRLAHTETVGPIGFRTLIARFGSARAALDALPELARRGGRERPLKIPSRRQAERIEAEAAREGIALVVLGDADYPAPLAAIEDAPAVLFAKGHRHLLHRPTVAIVGARNASAAGREQARRMAVALGEAGYVIVSGLARGIDAAAHEAALARGTIGVAAGGLDVPYPKENTALIHRIGAEGLLLSEALLGTRPTARHFPRRNRIVSGLALGVVVIEAAARSGSLITARLAGEQGREVFAVPGSPLDPRAAGTNRLIKQGAHLAESAADVISVLADIHPPAAEPEREGPFSIAGPQEPKAAPERVRAAVRALVGFTPVTLDTLVRETGADPAEVAAAVLELEIAGLLERLPGGRVVRKAE